MQIMQKTKTKKEKYKFPGPGAHEEAVRMRGGAVWGHHRSPPPGREAAIVRD